MISRRGCPSRDGDGQRVFWGTRVGTNGQGARGGGRVLPGGKCKQQIKPGGGACEGVYTDALGPRGSEVWGSRATVPYRLTPLQQKHEEILAQVLGPTFGAQSCCCVYWAPTVCLVVRTYTAAVILWWEQHECSVEDSPGSRSTCQERLQGGDGTELGLEGEMESGWNGGRRESSTSQAGMKMFPEANNVPRMGFWRITKNCEVKMQAE